MATSHAKAAEEIPYLPGDGADFQVEEALFREAVSGSITAQVFWLKNRMPERWRDKPEASSPQEEVRVVLDV